MHDPAPQGRRKADSAPTTCASPADGLAEPPRDPFRSTMVVAGDAPKAEYDEALRKMEEADAVLERCVKCDALLDVSGCSPLTETLCPNCQALIKVLKEFHHYMLLSKLGQGGSGTVYRAFDNSLERDVALKLLRNEYTRDPVYLEALEKEAVITASLRHHRIVNVYAAGQKNGFYYIAMEIVNGGTLDQKINHLGRLPEALALSVGIEIAEGLQAAAKYGLLHRDVKPGNVLFADDHSVKVADFGLAQPLTQEADLSADVWGTPAYMAPERLERKPEDLRSDIYSLGCTLFHCLAGRPPFTSTDLMELIHKQTDSPAPGIQAFAPEVSGATAFVLKRCLEKNPAERYQDYGELIEHLTYAQDQLEARPAHVKAMHSRTAAAPGGKRSLLALVALVIVAALVFGGMSFAKYSEQKRRRGAASQDFALGIKYLTSGEYTNGAAAFDRTRQHGEIAPAMAQWSLVCEGLANLLEGQADAAWSNFRALRSEASLRPTPDQNLNRFFTSAALVAEPDQAIAVESSKVFDQPGYPALGLLLLGLVDSTRGELDRGAASLQRFQSTAQTSEAYSWIAKLHGVADANLRQSDALRALRDRVQDVSSADAQKALLTDLRGIHGIFAPAAAALAEKVSAVKTSRSLVKNGGMEEGTGLPDGWDVYWGNGRAQRDTEVYHGGHASLLVDRAGLSGAANVGQQVDVHGGVRLVVGGWIKSAGAIKSNLLVQYFSGEGKCIDTQAIKFVMNDTDWTYGEKVLTLPDNTVRIALGAWMEGNGKVWLDDMTLSSP